MFSVRWLESGKESDPVEVENSIFTDLDKVVSFGKGEFFGMRSRHIARPPNGFVVVDAEGKEVSRWFASEADGLTAQHARPRARLETARSEQAGAKS
jgi:hypothetical protein